MTTYYSDNGTGGKWAQKTKKGDFNFISSAFMLKRKRPNIKCLDWFFCIMGTKVFMILFSVTPCNF